MCCISKYPEVFLSGHRLLPHLRAASLELRNESNVVALVLGVDVALLEHQAHHGGVSLDACGRDVLLKNKKRQETRQESGTEEEPPDNVHRIKKVVRTSPKQRQQKGLYMKLVFFHSGHGSHVYVVTTAGMW